MSAGSPSRPKFIMIGRGVAALHIGEVVGWRSIFSGDFSAKPTADPESSSPSYYTSIDTVSAEDVPLGGLIDTSHPMKDLSPKPLILGTSMGIFSLNV
jgi:hypothetical protein